MENEEKNIVVQELEKTLQMLSALQKKINTKFEGGNQNGK